MEHESNISQLHNLHHELENEILAENGRPLPDEIRISILKKRKLRIKDELLRLEANA